MTAEAAATPEPRSGPLVGTRVGAIRLLERLGGGGMGEVYLGLDERLNRRVAVKAIRAERRMDPSARARFLHEARVLSQLEHPGICRIHDYVEGESNDFLILELVPGLSLRDRMGQTLSWSEKLRIAVQVADSLVAAHAMSVVHRDLKPENVMVTPAGQAKVLDFGLAKTTSVEAGGEAAGTVEPRGGWLSGLTASSSIIGTPRYMSPEQARGEAVTAASDMYSFGLLLQELFSGRSAVAVGVAPEILIKKAMWGETEPLRGVDPQVASLVQQLTSLAARERPTAQATAERLRWIADRSRRRLRRATATGVAVLVVGAAVVSTVGFVQARRAQHRAERSEAQARQAQEETAAVNAFLRDMLTSPDPREMGIHVEVGDVLDRAATAADRAFAGQPASHAAVIDTLGSSFLALGDPEKARLHLSRALDMRTRSKGTGDPDTWRSMHGLGCALADLSRFTEAIALLRRTLELRAQGLGSEHQETLDTLLQLAYALQRDRQFPEARMLCQRALEGRRKALGPRHPDTLEAQCRLGSILTDIEVWAEAGQQLRESYEVSRNDLGVSHPQTIAALSRLGVLYFRQQRNEEARALYGEALARTREVLGAEHPEALRMAHSAGSTWTRLGRYAEALDLLRGTHAAQARVLGPAHADTLETMRGIGYALFESGRRREAERVYRERWDIARRYRGEEDRITLEMRSAMAATLVAAGRPDEAERIYREVLSVRRRVFGEGHEATERSKRTLAALLRRTGRAEEARALEASADPPAREH